MEGLGLSQWLGDDLGVIATAAAARAFDNGDHELSLKLNDLVAAASRLMGRKIQGTVSPPAATSAEEQDIVEIIAPGEKAIYFESTGTTEVIIERWRYTPKGMVYDLKSPEPGARWTVNAQFVRPFHGETRTIKVSLETGEEALQ